LIESAELGDYDPHRHKAGYVSEFRFLAHQSSDLETKIGELHKTIRCGPCISLSAGCLGSFYGHPGSAVECVW